MGWAKKCPKRSESGIRTSLSSENLVNAAAGAGGGREGNGGCVAIAHLSDHPTLVPHVAGWLYREWFRAQGATWHTARELLRRRLNRDHLPLALVAVAGAEPVGTVSLVSEDHPFEPGSVCSLAGLLVRP